MRPILACLALIWCCTVSSGVEARQNEQGLTGERVANSIQRGIRYLEREQSAAGLWSRHPQHPGGVCALCTLALLNAGVDPQERVIQRAMDHLDGLDIQRGTVYSISLMTMVYCLAQPENTARIRQCVDYLAAVQVKGRGNSSGGWPYTAARERSGRPDGSNSQFALLALHEASLLGIEVDQEVWQRSQWYWDSIQSRRGGGFYYSSQHQSVSGSMSCAGISSLIIIDENMPKRLPLKDGKIQCCTSEDRLEAVEKASEWLAARFSVRRNPTQGSGMFGRNNFYFLYGLERAARLSGQRYFGAHDWYREGADYLVRAQQGSGLWKGVSGHGENDPNIATALALLFLSKGRRPIVIGKYKHSDDNDWDRHRKGVHYLTRQLEADWNIKLNWQTIEGQYASADDLLESPVLFISGRDSLRLGEKQKEALRKYIEFGGFIFAEACQGDGCGENSGFEQDFVDLMAELFPDNKLQLLESDHPVYSSQYLLDRHPDRPLRGLQSSCRTSVIFCPRNLAGIWRVNRPSFMDQLPQSAKDQVIYATQLGANVIAYATGRELQDKLDRPKAVDTPDEGKGERVVLIPKLSHGGGADDAPNAWQNIMRRARFDLRQRFKLERQMIDPTSGQLARYPMVFMHGRTQFQWSDEERAALRTYFENGGFLFADSICSANAFVEAFRKEMTLMFPDYKLQRIPPTDKMWSDNAGGYQLDSVGMHEPAREAGGVRTFNTAPLLEGIQIDGRWVVVFSPHDLSCAMENASAQQCVGYDKDDAARIGVNIILYALMP